MRRFVRRHDTIAALTNDLPMLTHPAAYVGRGTRNTPYQRGGAVATDKRTQSSVAIEETPETGPRAISAILGGGHSAGPRADTPPALKR